MPARLLLIILLVAATGVARAQSREAAGAAADRVLAVRAIVGGETPQWSPDGSRIAFISSQGGSTGVWSIAAAGGAPSALVPDIGSVPYQMPYSARWSPTGQWVAYLSGKGGPPGAADQPGPTDLWIASVPAGREVQLTKLGARIGSLSWSPDGKWIAFSGGAGGNYDIWTVRVPEGDVYRLTSDPRFEVNPVWTPDGSRILYVRADQRWVDHEIVEMSLDGARSRVVIKDTDFFDYNTAGTAAFGPPLVSPDGRTVLFRSWRTGWINYWTVPLAGGEPRIVAREAADQGGASWSPDGRFISFTSNRNGTHVLSVVPAGGGQPRVLVNPGMGVVANAAWSPDSRRLSYTLVTPTRAADLYLAAVEGGAPQRLTVSTSAEQEKELVVPEKITYRSDSLTINAYLYRPPGAANGAKLPAIVFGHGGPTGQYQDTYDAQMQFFARQGYVVLAPNFRGGSGYGRAFADLNNKCWAHCDLDDLVAGVKYLKTLPYISGKVGITGTSHGGLLAMAGATFAPGVFQASVAHGGTADRIYYYNTQELRHIKQAENEFGPLATNEETYRYVSPFYFARDVNVPIFVIWGEGRWPGSENSRRYVAELERNYKTVRSKVYPGENYYVSGRTNTRQMLIDMLEFFDQYLSDKVTWGPPAATP